MMVPLPPSSTHAFFNSFTFASWTSWDKSAARPPRASAVRRSLAAGGKPGARQPPSNVRRPLWARLRRPREVQGC